MLQGTADIEALASAAPVVDTPATEAIALPAAEVLQVAWELEEAHRDELLPPAAK